MPGFFETIGAKMAMGGPLRRACDAICYPLWA
jgi:hypothetical protein